VIDLSLGARALAFTLRGSARQRKTLKETNWFIDALKCGEPVISDRLLEGGIKLKDRSAGGWRSGLQRSEK